MTAFDKIYKNPKFSKNDKIKLYLSFDQHSFFQKIIENFEDPKSLDPEKSKCSEVFAEYICTVARVSKPDFLEKIVIFVTLFIECLNSSHKSTCTESEYTEINNAEDAPDISNEFVTEFLESDENYFNLNKEEIIDITQNFCQWLYDNNFTCSKLSLITNI